MYPFSITKTSEWHSLELHSKRIQGLNLSTLLNDEERNKKLSIHHNNIQFDFSHQLIDEDILTSLINLAKKINLTSKISLMFQNNMLNFTEKRPVLHTSLRANLKSNFPYAKDVANTLTRIKSISSKIHSNNYIIKDIKTILVIGIGGSHLGTEFIYESLLDIINQNPIRTLKFIANVDPISILRNLHQIDPHKTIAIIISKSFTTSETMLNANVIKQWFIKRKVSNYTDHLFAVSSNISKCEKFGVKKENVFPIWNWVGGRFSVCSAVGVLPLSLIYGFDTVNDILRGAEDIDKHFLKADFNKNIPIIMGLLGVWNTSFLYFPAHAIIPYSEALKKFPMYIQQVEMESNGKRVTEDGRIIDYNVGEIIFGESGTNSQHSFFQTIHQGKEIPVDFIGFCRSKFMKRDINQGKDNNEESSKYLFENGHDELMSNFFAQPDALAYGKSRDALLKENVEKEVISHRMFPGNRPSLSLLFKELNAFSIGQLIAIYEHKVAVEGFIWGINSFDQFGVELGKELGKNVRKNITEYKKSKKIRKEYDGMSKPICDLFKFYLENRGSD